MQRITDIWRNLVRYPGGQANAAQARDEDEEESDDRDQEIAEAYRNQYWTRLVSLQRGRAQQLARWPLVADIIECLTEIEGREEQPAETPAPIFDPAEFQQRHSSPALAEFELDEGRLRELAIQGTQIRAQFSEKADAYGRLLVTEPEPSEQGRTRRGQTYSVAARDPEGLAEKDRRKRAEQEQVPARHYKARHRNSLSWAEQLEIVEAYADHNIPQKEVARRFRISPQLVGSLVRDSKKKPEKLRVVKEKEKRQDEEKQAIQSAIAGMQRGKKLISSTKAVQEEVEGSSNLEVSARLVRQVLRQDCKLSFVRAKKFYPQANSARCRVLRQQYALEMLELLEQGKRVINIDETWLNETSFIRRAWAPKDGRSNVPLRSITPRLSMIAALDTDGRAWFALAHANSDSNMMALFLLELTKLLDAELPGWQEDTIFLLDNAPYHCSQETRAAVDALGIRLIYSGPYSYSAAPIETLFAHLKLGELNADGQATGKR